ncbi:uncharacterized protein G2W53_027554 [Senna tora]|uniref:Uncharacterized protein n=1 Tax=Senna tora TaxID=362788 RepID=A0A834TJ76_9FABA|nr:uncharacterized protein G2W53_027554 [Senna tora]
MGACALTPHVVCGRREIGLIEEEAKPQKEKRLSQKNCVFSNI